VSSNSKSLSTIIILIIIISLTDPLSNSSCYANSVRQSRPVYDRSSCGLLHVAASFDLYWKYIGVVGKPQYSSFRSSMFDREVAHNFPRFGANGEWQRPGVRHFDSFAGICCWTSNMNVTAHASGTISQLGVYCELNHFYQHKTLHPFSIVSRFQSFPHAKFFK